MKNTLTMFLCASALLFGADKDKGDYPFVTHTELSYVQTEGNTDTTAFSLDFSGTKSWKLHSLKLDLDALYGTENDLESKNKVFGELNYDWLFAKHFTLNYVAGYKNDRFSGFDYQYYTGPGAKYIALDDEVFKLDFQANALYNADQEMDKYFDAGGGEVKYPYPDGKEGLTKVSGDYRNYWGYMLKGNFKWMVVKGFKFIQEASYRSNFEEGKRYFAYSKSAVESKINSMFSMGVSYKVDYANRPPEGNERADKTFMTSLIIDY